MINDSIYYAIGGVIYLLFILLLARFLGINELDETKHVEQLHSGDSPYDASGLPNADAAWPDETEMPQAPAALAASPMNGIDRRDGAIRDRRTSAIRDRRHGIRSSLGTRNLGAT